jgi:hypothetical protein
MAERGAAARASGQSITGGEGVLAAGHRGGQGRKSAPSLKPQRTLREVAFVPPGDVFPWLALRACVVNGVFYPAGARPVLEMVVHQEAVGVAREVTNWREPLTSKGRLGRFSESVGHNVSERRASLENATCGSRPAVRTGKAAAAGAAQPVFPWFRLPNGVARPGAWRNS